MRKGKTKKTNFTRLAKRTLAGALSLSMVFSLNMLTMADNSGEATADSTAPATIDFSASGVVLDKTGNAATIDGKTIKFGEASKDKSCGVEIKNPFVGNTELTSETLADALANSKTPLNAYVYKKGTEDEWTYVVAPYATVEEASAAAAKYADPSVTGVSIVTKDEDLEPYPNWFSETADIKIASMSELTSGEAAELSFPRPEWKNGITVSTWVKASTKYATPIFVFQDRNEEKYWNSATREVDGKTEEYKNEDFGGLALYTDGTFIYNQDDGVYKNDKWQNKAYGYYQNNKTTMQFDSADMPTKNIGEWVYVTVSIKNSGVDVYYNGVKASVKKDDPKKYFNSGFNSNGKALSSILKDNAYMQRLTETWICKKGDTWESLNSILPAATSFKNWMQNYDSDGVKYCDDMIKYITNPTTKLYLGGDDGHSSDWLVNQGMDTNVNSGYIGFDYTNAAKDMELKELSLVANPTSAADATKQYMEIAGIEVPKSDAEYTFAYNEDEDTFDGVDKLNSDVNNSEGAKDEYDNPTIKLGEVADGEIGQGVRAINPFRNKTELHEDFVKALEKTGKHFNGYTYPGSNTNAEGKKYNWVSEASTLKEAQEFYKKNGERKAAEFKRKRLMQYAAKTIITDGAITLTGDATTVSYEAIKVEPATGMSLLEIMWVHAKVYYQSANNSIKEKKWDANQGLVDASSNIAWDANKVQAAIDGKPQSSMNFVKNMVTLNYYPTDEVLLDWMKNEQITFSSLDDPKIGEKFGEAGKEQTEEEYVGYLEPDENAGDYTFPYPTWEKGVSVSTWVKAPAVSGDAAYPTVFEFSNNTASLYLKSDGTLKFMESTDPTSEAGKNVFKAKFTGNTPNDNAGQWVYVTITVTNDNIDVFYNGVKATMTADGAYKLDGTATQNFNYGTGFGNTNIKDRVASCVKAGRYRDLLQNYADSTTYDDYSKYSFKNTTLQLIDFLTGDKTHLYLGGNNVAPESAYDDTANAGMEFGKTSFYNSAISENNAAYLYVIAKGEREAVKEDPTPTGPAVTTTPPAVTTTPPGVTTTPPGVTTTPPGVTTTPPGVTTTPPSVSVEPGDANLDGAVDLKDATLVLKAALNIEQLEEQAKLNADINKNGEIDLQDATSVLKLALNIKL